MSIGIGRWIAKVCRKFQYLFFISDFKVLLGDEWIL